MNKSSSVLFWLLLAATLCVDAVAAFWTQTSNWSDNAVVLTLGLAFSQLSLGCIWSTFKAGRSRWLWLLPYVGSLLAAPLISPLLPGSQGPSSTSWPLVLAFVLLFWLHVSVLFVALWLTKQSRFSPVLPRASNERRWQVSLQQLLVVTTVLAIVLTLGKNIRIFHDDDYRILPGFTVNNVVIAVAAAALIGFKLNPLKRFAILCAVAIITSGFLWLYYAVLTRETVRDIADSLVANLIQAVMLTVWLQWGSVMPHVVRVDGDATPQDSRIADTPG